MGISNLLPFVQKACRQGNTVELKGCSIAIDVSCLLHKGLFGCMEQFAEGKDTKFYIYYVKKHVQSLLDIGCHVILVFDGRPLPAKKDTNADRRQRRVENMRAGEVLMSQGKKEEAIGKFQQAVSITQEVVENTIEFFRKMEQVDVIVSPYESDAQLTFLTKNGMADAVITEDSDLIAFGCDKIVFKWNSDSGACTIYEKENLYKCFGGEMNKKFDFDKFRRICILSGCDYLQAGLPGVGLAKAVTFFSKTEQTNLRMVLPKVPSYLKMSKLKVTPQFIEDFIRAENTFLYQVVFDPRQRCQRPLNPYPLGGIGKTSKENEMGGEDEMDDDFVKKPKGKEESGFSFAGIVSAASTSVRLALGNNAESQAMMDKFLLPAKLPEWSVWSDRFESAGKRRRRREEEALKKSKQCGGAFVLDSPSKRVKKVRTRVIEMDDEIMLGDTPEKKEERKEEKNETKKRFVSKASAKRKLLKNEADQSWSIDEMIKMYADPPAGTNEGGVAKMEKEGVAVNLTLAERVKILSRRSPVTIEDDIEMVTITTSSSTVRKVDVINHDVTSEEVKKPDDSASDDIIEIDVKPDSEGVTCTTESKSSTTVKREEKMIIEVKEEKKEKTVASPIVTAPVLRKRPSFQSPLLGPPSQSPLNPATTSSSIPKQTGKSSYFLQKSASCSNPFKRPRFDSPLLSSPAASPAVNKETTPSKKSLLPPDEDENEADDKDGVTSYRFSPISRSVGFRAPGLRRSKTS